MLRRAAQRLSLALSVFLLCLAPFSASGAQTCHDLYGLLRTYVHKAEAPLLLYADGTSVPLGRAFEKEGLFYREIAQWFDTVDDVAKAKLSARLEDELAGKKPGKLLNWLKAYPKKYRAPGARVTPKRWESWTPRDQLAFINNRENPFEVINVKGREDLFLDDHLTFNELRVSEITPEFLDVGDDLGSYEVKTRTGQLDKIAYERERAQIENAMQSRVGHQHVVHAWPTDPARRAAIAPQYIELLDSGTWYLYWRQVKRNPDEIESIVFHPFLGVYNRTALERLHTSVVKGHPETFKNKYRMIGARRFKPLNGAPSDGWEMLPDFELRSGNKGEKRDFIMDLIEARLASGDYTGLRDFRAYDFDASAPIGRLAAGLLTPGEIAEIEKFEKLFPKMRYSADKRALNHYRNKAVAPLLKWEERIDIGYKEELLHQEQKAFAKKLAALARKFNTLVETPGTDIADLRDYIGYEIEKANFEFAEKVRLDVDFERYLKPRPEKLPSILVESKGPLNVNEFPIGIEYSFRFPQKPSGRMEAEKEILKSAEAFRDQLGGGTIRRLEDGGHGHGLSVRYEVKDPGGKTWRVEWDGIQRDYDAEGRAINPHGGHIEVPSPKFSPAAMEDMSALFASMRKMGREPKRSAGGGHFNIGLDPLFKLPPKEGARKLANFISVFESNREMVGFLWQHPKRLRVAEPLPIGKTFAEALDAFSGDWDELSELLYTHKYFNPYVGRKPAYAQLNAVGLLKDSAPLSYRKSIDIKKDEWFPSFAGKTRDRIELRLSDAPMDEWQAALQIKYMRALLERAMNAEKAPLIPVFPKDAHDVWRKDPAQFVKDAEVHLESLGLDPKEFYPLLSDSLAQQMSAKPNKRMQAVFDGFLPSEQSPATLKPEKKPSQRAPSESLPATLELH